MATIMPTDSSSPRRPLQHFARVRMSPSQAQRLQRLLRLLLRLCQICCIAPVAPTVSGARRCWHYLRCALLLGYIVALNAYSARQLDTQSVTIEKALYLSEYVTNSLIVSCIVGSCLYYADHFEFVPRQLCKLYRELKRFQPERRAQQQCLYATLYRELCYLCTFISCFMLGLFYIDFVYLKYDVLRSLVSSGAYNLPNLLISMNLLQYWLALRFICLLYRRLNDVLAARLKRFNINGGKKDSNTNMSTSPEVIKHIDLAAFIPFERALMWYQREFATFGLHAPTSTDYEILEFVRKLYAELDRLLAQLVNAFGCILVLNFLGSFLDLSVEYYAIYKFFDNPAIMETKFVLFIYKLLWLVMHTGRIFFVLISNNAIIQEKCRTSFILNELHITSKDMEHAINRFLLQLMVRKQSEMACGIIDLDLIFLSGITSALANYIIFLIQIDLGISH